MGKASNLNSLRERKRFLVSPQGLSCLQIKIIHMLSGTSWAGQSGAGCPEPHSKLIQGNQLVLVWGAHFLGFNTENPMSQATRDSWTSYKILQTQF